MRATIIELQIEYPDYFTDQRVVEARVSVERVVNELRVVIEHALKDRVHAGITVTRV